MVRIDFKKLKEVDNAALESLHPCMTGQRTLPADRIYRNTGQ
ncbi:MAG: hypothetical protein ACI9X4_000153 [Glaciecola sp.]|jgi:hypothetical protein